MRSLVLLKKHSISFSSEKTTFLLLVAILLFFNLNDLSVRINEINYWDEAQYIMFGRAFVLGTLPSFSWSPFTSAFFALLYLPFTSTGNWLPIVATLGRVIIYILLFLSLYLISKEIEEIPWTAAIFGMALVSPAMVSILKFQSDALFAVNSAFSLWQVLQYRRTGQKKNLWLASFFSGLAALTRNDGLILYIAFLFIVLFIIKNEELKLKHKLIASIIPFASLFLGYLILYAIVTGNFYVGTKERSWGAFRQGQYFIYGDNELCQTNQLHCAIEQVTELYGNGEENNYSIANAIRKNPQAYTDRLIRSLKMIPEMIYKAYGGRIAISLTVFVLAGVFELFKRNRNYLSCMLNCF